ncbi:MAG: GGDEF domain-containing protein [Bacilli bacterium]|nr:GGDEF domain-containing protein [Bacilli bacterium]
MFSIFYTSKSIRKQNELSRRADYDELTSLYNRHALNQIGNNCIHQAKMAKANFSVAIIDIDYFKKINDTYGHAKGDDVLKELSSIIRSFSIRGIIPGRWGGEEFIMIAPYTIDYNEFCVVLEKLREKIEKYKFAITAKNNIAITISIGASSVKNVSTLDEAVSFADKNLYQAKESGRNKLVS